MKRIGLILSLSGLVAPNTALGESLVAARNLPARSVISEADLRRVATILPGALTEEGEAIGQETRVAIYAGRAIRASDLTPPALIERNAIVPLIYAAPGLVIQTEGRALERAAVGEAVRVSNLASRTIVSGILNDRGQVIVAAH